MGWQDQLNKAIQTVKSAAESDRAREIAATAKATATSLLQKAKDGAISAADALVEANRDPSAIALRFLNADVTIVSPSEGISISRPDAGTLVISDGKENGIVINAGADPAFVVETIGSVKQVNDNTYDLGDEDGVDVVVTKF
jgi:hypothetical protein